MANRWTHSLPLPIFQRRWLANIANPQVPVYRLFQLTRCVDDKDCYRWPKLMKPGLYVLTALAFFLISLNLSASGQRVTSSKRRASLPPQPSVKMRPEWRDSSERALARLRVLRDGWNDVNPQFIKKDFVAARRLNPQEYEVQYLEAKAAVDEAFQVLPKGDLRAAIEQSMDLFDDLEVITKIFNKTSPFTTNVRAADVFPYLKKYGVPYESGVSSTISGLTLHQDFMMSYILPIRYARVNRVEVLLGGAVKPVPPPPTYEQMFRVPERKETTAPATVEIEELKEVAGLALTARLHGDRDSMGGLLDDKFVYSGTGGRRWDKVQYLRHMSADPTVKGFTIERAELGFRSGAPTLSTTIRYESFKGEAKSYENTFIFAMRNGKWLIAGWRPF